MGRIGGDGNISSHYKLIKDHCNKRNYNKLLCIFEDDIEFCKDFSNRLKYIEDNFISQEWDIFYLGCFYHMPYNVPKLTGIQIIKCKSLIMYKLFSAL